jgi:hypothetical protein
LVFCYGFVALPYFLINANEKFKGVRSQCRRSLTLVENSLNPVEEIMSVPGAHAVPPLVSQPAVLDSAFGVVEPSLKFPVSPLLAPVRAINKTDTFLARFLPQWVNVLPSRQTETGD